MKCLAFPVTFHLEINSESAGVFVKCIQTTVDLTIIERYLIRVLIFAVCVNVEMRETQRHAHFRLLSNMNYGIVHVFQISETPAHVTPRDVKC